MKQTKRLSETFFRYLRRDFPVELSAAAVFAAGLEIFTAPAGVVGGGVSGIATLLYVLFDLPIGVMTLLINLPLLLIGYRRLGRAFILQTLRMVLIITVMTDVVMARVPSYSGDILLASLFGGVLIGAGLGIVLRRGGTTGGTDIIVKLLKLRYPHISFGKLVIATDLAVIGMAALVYRRLDMVLYGIVVIYVAGEAIDRIISGADARRMMLVVTKCRDAIAQAVVTELDRGATLLDAVGAYSGKPVGVLLCVVENQQMHSFKKLVRRIDDEAFMIITHAAETLGEGFKSINDER